MKDKYYKSNSNMINMIVNKDKNLIVNFKYESKNEYLFSLSLIDIECNLIYESVSNDSLSNYIMVEYDSSLIDKIIYSLSSYNKDPALIFSLDTFNEKCSFKIQQKVKSDFIVNLFQLPLTKNTLTNQDIFNVSLISFRNKIKSKIECCQMNEELREEINELSNKLINISIDHEQERTKMYDEMCEKLNDIKNNIIKLSGRTDLAINKKTNEDDDGKSKSYAYSLNDL